MADRQTSSRRALQQNAARPWEAAGQEVLEPIITSSFRAPEDVPLHTSQVWTEPVRRPPPTTRLLEETFAQRRYGAARYRLYIDEAKGSDGLSGPQTLSLVSRKESAHTLICGWVDMAQSEAQVRGYGVVARRYERRHGQPFPLDEEEYGRFLDKLMDTLFDAGFQILHLVSEEEGLQAADSQEQWRRAAFRSSRGVTVLVVGAFALGLNAAHLIPKFLQHAPAWFAQAGSWFSQAGGWATRLVSWLA